MRRVLLPNGEEMPPREEPVYFIRLVTTARLYDVLPELDGPSRSVTTFIAFHGAIGVGVYIRSYQHMDLAALVVRRL